MKKKNGFTLIELLAIIVILAIIALIATPIILNLIEKSRRGAARDSAYGLKKAAQVYYQSLLLDDINGISDNIIISFENGNIISSISNSDVKFDLDGKVPSSGSITIDTSGKIKGSITINNYVCSIQDSENIYCGKYKKYENGEIVYFDPTTNKFCSNYNIDNSITEYKGDDGSKTTNNQTSCLKWYAYLDNEDSKELKLLLDHNTTARVRWNTDSDRGINVSLGNSNLKSLLDDLYSKEETGSKWLVMPTIITAEDIALITNYKETTGKNWSSSINDTFLLDTNTRTQKKFSESVRSKYAWLFDKTRKCKTDTIDYGCNYEEENTYKEEKSNDAWKDSPRGYWTSTLYGEPEVGEQVWTILGTGDLTHYIANSGSFGIRPVVVINKDIQSM